MNKIVNINLGGFPFTIDEDAYSSLRTYLETLKSHFSMSPGYEEIMYDIEARMAELFMENNSGTKIISNKDLGDTMKIMGTPEDFGAIAEEYAEPKQNANSNTSSHSSAYTGKRINKRLFRDGDDKVISGVCSGIAAYFGWSDPLWVRILALVLLFTGGLSIIPYIILILIVPEAKTSADKLAMKGEPINIDTIAKTVKDEVDGIVERGTGTWSDLGSKKKAVKQPLFRSDQPFPRGFLF